MQQVVKVFTVDLAMGMYVASLDRPWLETPFAVQGFEIKSPEEISRLRDVCSFVYVDVHKGAADHASVRRKERSRPRKSMQQIFDDRLIRKYQDEATWEEEYPRAQEAVEILSDAIDQIFLSATKAEALNMASIKKAVEPMVSSMCRNPDALIWLARMKQEDQYSYQHSLGASIWAVALGRQIGLPRSDLRSLAIGGLLFDVGKLQLDKTLLAHVRPLSDDEFAQVKGHVELGVQALRRSSVLNQDVIDMVAHHHERHDGSGYPAGLAGEAIPVFARMAAIVDCYDAITSHRSYARAIPPSDAIKNIHEWKGVDFQVELVEEFIQAMGIYPAGTLVVLSSGEVAVVGVEYRTRRLRPEVRVLLDRDKRALAVPKVINLHEVRETEDGKKLEIVDALPPGAHGIDLRTIPL